MYYMTLHPVLWSLGEWQYALTLMSMVVALIGLVYVCRRLCRGDVEVEVLERRDESKRVVDGERLGMPEARVETNQSRDKRSTESENVNGRDADDVGMVSIQRSSENTASSPQPVSDSVTLSFASLSSTSSSVSLSSFDDNPDSYGAEENYSSLLSSSASEERGVSESEEKESDGDTFLIEFSKMSSTNESDSKSDSESDSSESASSLEESFEFF